MRLITWKKTFYRVPADTDMNTLEAIDHSLKKWIGLRAENMEKHGLEKKTGATGYLSIITDGSEIMRIGTVSCALCVKFYPDPKSEQHNCVDCPLYVANGRRRCDEDNENGVNLFFIWNSKITCDPEPMIAALRRTSNLQYRRRTL